VKRIELSGRKAAGRAALVDDADYELVRGYTWYVLDVPRTGGRTVSYALARVGRRPDRSTIYMHALIAGARPDHANGDGLDNRRENLRPATRRQNGRNSRPRADLTKTSQYKGVCWDKRAGKWRVQIGDHGRRRHVGHFTDEVEAARAYDAAAHELYGEFAWPNFPSS
jgi:hypothetical protein